ncbi:MAG: hypothetical protein QCI00_07540 [Candidatus Thermoplasmatota archaeon]|nr:hypothetical protein [Candidatus Thermoplasmatota archaeon]
MTKEVIVLHSIILISFIIRYEDSTSVLTDDYIIEPGFGTASNYLFTDEIYGATLSIGRDDNQDTNTSAIFTGPAPKTNGQYVEQFALMLTISNGRSYDIKYNYERRE